ncbi:helix-turn-helix domain-containing protein [Micromonospora echinofusca]|uniref:Helix-turn-helix domain-containing protein n=1 Tax=Micromonospora echinofusca TaxID=47858 RepID=A0ABS3VLW5_MICEH|nr:helix-turn-helix transcriptional regulator [Micromonospora echinofusca]MBO4205476.1 helix-turn-helix domain-containing protein [Micromonospora echinofusca]
MPSALDPPPPQPSVGQYPVSGLVRRARRIAGLGQRQMARFAKVAPSTVGKVEAGRMTPSIAVLERLLGAAGLFLAVVDQDGRVIQPMRDWDETFDGAGRRYPSHLSTILDPEPGEWWADIYGLARPPETFHRSHVVREMQRRRSQWEVRVAKHRHLPPPPNTREQY